MPQHTAYPAPPAVTDAADQAAAWLFRAVLSPVRLLLRIVQGGAVGFALLVFVWWLWMPKLNLIVFAIGMAGLAVVAHVLNTLLEFAQEFLRNSRPRPDPAAEARADAAYARAQGYTPEQGWYGPTYTPVYPAVYRPQRPSLP